jgi:hypothetical protein
MGFCLSITLWPFTSRHGPDRFGGACPDQLSASGKIFPHGAGAVF